MAKDTYYFSHDSNARNDIKILKLRRVHGMEGYGIYFAIIEILREATDNVLPLDSIADIAYDLKVGEQVISEVIHGFDLFTIQGNTFYSDSLLRRMQGYNELKAKRIEAGKRGAKAKLEQSLSNAEANVKQSSSKPSALNEIKVNETKLNKSKPFTPPALSEVVDYFIENGYRQDAAEKAFQYYKENNWKDSRGKQVLAWKQKMTGNWFKPENKAIQIGKAGGMVW